VSDIVGRSIKKITKGAAIFFAGSTVGLLASFFGKIIVARYLDPPKFGVLSLSLVIFSIFCVISLIGIPGAMTRQASYYLGKGETEKAEAIIKLSAILLTSFSILASLIMFITSNYFARVFTIPTLCWTLKVFSIAIPFVVLRSFVISAFRIYEIPEVKVLFGDVIPNITRVSMIIVIVLLGLSFTWIVWAYSISTIISGVAAIIYLFKKLNLTSKINRGIFEYIFILLTISIPLLLQRTLGLIMAWTDVIMIGYFMRPIEIGLYSSAQPVAYLMSTALVSAGFLYLPVISKLYAENKLTEIKKVYAIITKWLTSAVMPIFLLLLLFPRTVLWVLYGSKYLAAYEVLRILAIGFFLHVAFGPNGVTLLALGDVKEITLATLAAAIINILLNLMLIPPMSIEGAAIASAVSYIFANIFISAKLYKSYKIHPFTKNYLKPIISSIIIAQLIYFVAKSVLLKWWMLMIAFFAFVIGYFITLLLTKSFDREDIMLLLAIEQRLGLNMKGIKRILSKFI